MCRASLAGGPQFTAVRPGLARLDGDKLLPRFFHVHYSSPSRTSLGAILPKRSAAKGSVRFLDQRNHISQSDWAASLAGDPMSARKRTVSVDQPYFCA